MARVKFSPIVTDIAGSVGGVTFQRNKFGNTIRQKPLPLNPATSAQYNVRQKIASLQHSWQNLTDAQRLQWDRFLAFSGQTIKNNRSVKLSGHSLYLKYQLWRLLCGQSLLTTILYVPMPDYYDIDYLLTDVASNLIAFFKGVIDSTKYFFVLKLSSPRPANQAFSHKGLRFILSPFGSSNNYDIKASYLSAFGFVPPSSTYLHYSILYFSVISPVYSGVFTGKILIQ